MKNEGVMMRPEGYSSCIHAAFPYVIPVSEIGINERKM